MILNEGSPAVERYIEFLKGGNSDYPWNFLKKQSGFIHAKTGAGCFRCIRKDG